MFAVELDWRLPVWGGSGLNEGFGFANQRVSNNPVDPKRADVAGVQLRQLCLLNLDASGQSGAGFSRLIQVMMSHRQDHVSFDVAVPVIGFAQDLVHVLHSAGKAPLAILGKAFGELEPLKVAMVFACCEGGIR